jgi:hypothetical protein
LSLCLCCVVCFDRCLQELTSAKMESISSTIRPKKNKSDMAGMSVAIAVGEWLEVVVCCLLFVVLYDLYVVFI